MLQKSQKHSKVATFEGAFEFNTYSFMHYITHSQVDQLFLLVMQVYLTTLLSSTMCVCILPYMYKFLRDINFAVFVYVCMYDIVRMLHVCTYICMYVRVCMYVCMYVFTHACMYVCM